MGSDASPPSFQYKSKRVFGLFLEFIPPYVFLLNPEYVNSNNNKQLLLLLLLLLLLSSIRILVIWFTCPLTIYFKFITSLLRQLILLQSAIGIRKCDNFITKCDNYYKVRHVSIHLSKLSLATR